MICFSGIYMVYIYPVFVDGNVFVGDLSKASKGVH